MCKAFSTKCTKCEEVGHFAKFCRPPRPAGGKPKGEHIESQNMGVMHHTITTINTNLCQNKMSTKTVSKQNIKSWKKNRINVTLKNEEFDHYLNKYVERKPAPPPKINVSIKLDIRSYKTHDPPLECKIALDYVQKCKDSKLQPYVAASTADTGAQANILGLNHLNKLGLNIGCLHRSATIMDCANSSKNEVIGAFLGCIRAAARSRGEQQYTEAWRML